MHVKFINVKYADDAHSAKYIRKNRYLVFNKIIITDRNEYRENFS